MLVDLPLRWFCSTLFLPLLLFDSEVIVRVDADDGLGVGFSFLAAAADLVNMGLGGGGQFSFLVVGMVCRNLLVSCSSPWFCGESLFTKS